MSTLFVDTINEKTSGNGINIPGHVVQVVSSTKTDTYSQTAGSFAEVTGMSASITPSSTNNKVLVSVSFMASYTDDGTVTRRACFSLFKGSTNLLAADSPGSRQSGFVEIQETASLHGSRVYTYTYLDAPNTTDQVTYSLRAKNHGGGSSTLYVNRSVTDEDSAIAARGVSQIQLMEIAQ